MITHALPSQTDNLNTPKVHGQQLCMPHLQIWAQIKLLKSALVDDGQTDLVLEKKKYDRKLHLWDCACKKKNPGTMIWTKGNLKN